jgi:hypothetical protein
MEVDSQINFHFENHKVSFLVIFKLKIVTIILIQMRIVFFFKNSKNENHLR